MDKKDEFCQVDQRTYTNHDEAFKKLLETFFAEFIQLFFPELDEKLDHSQTRFLMQELLVDIVGQDTRSLDLLLETKYKELDAFILIHLEPQSYKDLHFEERMFIYYSRIYERHRHEHKVVIPIAIFTHDDAKDERDVFSIAIPNYNILRFQFLKVELKSYNWREFIDSDNPVAAALLAKMGYNNEKERRDIRLAYLRMLMRLQHRLDPARMALMMSIGDLYYKPSKEEDQILLEQLQKEYAKEGVSIMKLMPAWKKWGYDEGIEEGIEKGIEKGLELGLEQGIEKGLQIGKEAGKEEVIRKFLAKGFSPEVVADAIGTPVEEIRKYEKR